MSVVINGSAGVTTNSGAVYNGISSGTAVASTSGTSIDFTSIPSWVKRVTVMFSGVSTSGTSLIQIQTGSGSVTTTGYNSNGSIGSSLTQATATTGLLVDNAASASVARNGVGILALLGSNTYTWSYIGSSGSATCTGGGAIALSGALDRVRITTVNGTDTFDAGSINILYE